MSPNNDPTIGRFTSADSIVPPGVQGLDRYAYGLNNPSRYTDPSGHIGEDTTDSCGPDGIYCDPTPDSYVNWDPDTNPIGLGLKDRQAAEDAYIHALKDPQHFYNLYFNSNLNAWESNEVAYLNIYLGYSTLHTSADRYILGLYGQDVTTSSVMRAMNSSDPQAAMDYMKGLSAITLAGYSSSVRPGQWTTPRNAMEQEAMDYAMKNFSTGTQLKFPLNRGSWTSEAGWIKMQRIYNSVEIHYVWNPSMDLYDDFKFVGYR